MASVPRYVGGLLLLHKTPANKRVLCSRTNTSQVQRVEVAAKLNSVCVLDVWGCDHMIPGVKAEACLSFVHKRALSLAGSRLFTRVVVLQGGG